MRSNRADVDEALRTALAEYVVEGVEAPPNFSVIIGGEAGPGDMAVGLHFLYKNHNAIVRSRWPERVFDGLFAHLGAHSPAPSANGLLPVTGVGLIKEGQAILAPAWITNRTDTLAPRLNRGGVQFVDSPRVALDVEAGQLVVEEPGLIVNRAALAELNPANSPGREPKPVQPGRYPLVGWALFTDSDDDVGPISAANGIVATAPGLFHRSLLRPEQVMRALGRLFSVTRPVAIGSANQGDLAEKLLRAFSV